MKDLIISVVFTCLCCIGFQQSMGQHNYSSNLEVCPTEIGEARSIVENFLTEPSLSDARSETGTTGLTVNNIAHLDNPDDTYVCEVLNNDFSHFDGDFRKVVYYQAGDHYFVSAPLVVPDTSEYSIIGPDFIIVLDSDFNTLGRYRGP